LKIDEGLKQLEEITKRLEDENIPLEEAIELFEKGITIAAAIKESLDQAKLKVKQVLEKADGTFELSDFDLSQ